MFRRGRRTFSIASILLILVACAHGAGGFAPPQSEAQAAITRAMAESRVDAGIMRFSTLDVFRSVWFTMGLLVILWAAQNLVVAALASANVYRAFTRLSLAMSVALVALYWFYRIPPPLISFAIVVPPFAFSAFTAAKET